MSIEALAREIVQLNCMIASAFSQGFFDGYEWSENEQCWVKVDE